MSAPAIRTGSPRTPSLLSGMEGTGYLLRFVLRRDWIRLMVWSVALPAFCAYYVVAISAFYPTAEDQQNRAATMSNPGGVFLSGPAYGLDNYTIGAMFANEMVLWLIAFLATMNILQITRNTRAEEEAGRTELVRALPVGRHAASVAAFLEVVIADAIFVLLGSVLLISLGNLAVPGTVVMMTGLAVTALVFAGVATATCQLTVHARGASGLAFAALGAAVLTRGIGDIMAHHGSWLSWLSPVAWTQQTRAYVDIRLWPLGLSVIAVVVSLGLGAPLASRRDLGGGLVRERARRADASPALAGPLALAFRQQRTALLSWLVGCVAMFGLSGLFLGRDAEDLLESIAEQNALTSTLFGDDALNAFVALLMLHNALAVAVFAISTALRVKSEEDDGRLGLELSYPASRSRLLLTHLAAVVLGAFVLVFIGGALALWIGASSSGGTIDLEVLLTSAGAFALSIAVLIAVTATLYAWVPRATPLAWVLFAFVVVESFFGALLGLPDAISKLSPFWWVGDYPSAPLEPSHMIGLGATAFTLLALAVIGFRRRDLTAG